MIRYPNLVLLQNPILSPELWTRCPQLRLPAPISRPWPIGAGFVKPLRVSQILSVQTKELNGRGYPFELPMSLSWSTGYNCRHIPQNPTLIMHTDVRVRNFGIPEKGYAVF